MTDWSWLVRGAVLERDGWRISRVGPAGARRYPLWAPAGTVPEPRSVDAVSRLELVGVYESAEDAKARADGAP